MGSFIKNLQRYSVVLEDDLLEIEKKIQQKNFKKGDFLYKAGQMPSALFILNSGCLKNYYEVNDKVFNSWFLFEDIFFFAANSLYGGKPTYENAIFLEDSSVSFISGTDLQSLSADVPVMNLFLKKILEEYCVILEERLFLNHKRSPKERYEALLNEYPQITQSVSLGNIAAYLGISQETLSRLRGK